MPYTAPLDDIMFGITHLSSWEAVTANESYAHVGTSDVDAVLQSYGRFCGEVIAELSQVGDNTGSRLEGETVVMPAGYAEAYSQFTEMGWQSLRHPEAYGGMGFPRAVAAAAAEILNSADMSFGLCPLLTEGAIEALLLTGSDSQKQRYLAPLVSGRWSGTMNLTEPQAGSDLGRVRCKAVAQDDGTFALHGTKIFITYGDHELSENIIHLVLARTADAPPGPRGLSLFIVPKFLVNDDETLGARNQVRCVSLEHKLGIKASPTAMLEFDGATGFLIGQENNGLAHMFIMMMSARFLVGVQGVAVAERAYQHALSYANERIQSPPVD